VFTRREAPRPAVGAPRCAVVLLAAVLLTPGCVTPGPRTLSTRREAAVEASPFQAPVSTTSLEEDAPQRLHRRRGARGLGSDVTRLGAGETAVHEVASGGSVPQGLPTCGGQAVPRGWPDFSSGGEALLAPFLTCTSPAEYVALQQRVDMPRLLEALDNWSAVRLGALGPPPCCNASAPPSW
jgi:hypothetical protein